MEQVLTPAQRERFRRMRLRDVEDARRMSSAP